MSEDRPDNDPPTYLADFEESHDDQGLPEDAAFLEDLRYGYTNPEIYGDHTQPQTFILPIFSLYLPNNPVLIYSEVNGDLLPDQLLEAFKAMMLRNPNLEGELDQYGETLEQYVSAFMADPEVSEFKAETWKFFLRHFPKFMQSAFNIAAMSAIMSTTLLAFRREPDSKLNEVEKLSKDALSRLLTDFEKMVKQLVETRSTSGRPKLVYGKGELPEVVTNVIRTAYQMMGDSRGKDAVPGLKEVAVRLSTNEGALGRRLRLAGHPWTNIRTWLENLPSDPT